MLQQYLPFTVLKQFNEDFGDTIDGCNSTYRLRYWNTAASLQKIESIFRLQQYLPFTVLKPNEFSISFCDNFFYVATVLTVYGIETPIFAHERIWTATVATVLTVYGIET